MYCADLIPDLGSSIWSIHWTAFHPLSPNRITQCHTLIQPPTPIMSRASLQTCNPPISHVYCKLTPNTFEIFHQITPTASFLPGLKLVVVGCISGVNNSHITAFQLTANFSIQLSLPWIHSTVFNECEGGGLPGGLLLGSDNEKGGYIICPGCRFTQYYRSDCGKPEKLVQGGIFDPKQSMRT